MMRATIIKVHPARYGARYHAMFMRVEFALENGDWAHTDLVPTYRNYAQWSPVEVGATYEGVRLFEGQASKVDADSPVVRVSGPICQLVPKGTDRQARANYQQQDLL